MTTFTKSCFLLLIGLLFVSNAEAANNSEYETVAKHAESIRCDAERLKSIVKSEFRRTDCYGKIRLNITGLKLKAAKVRRRANTIRSAKWEREFNKIDEYICKLNELLIQTIESDEGYTRALERCLPDVTCLLDNMSADLQCMRIALGCPLPGPAALGTPRATRRLSLPLTPAPNYAPTPGPPVEYPTPNFVEPTGEPIPAPIPESLLPSPQNERLGDPVPQAPRNSILIPRTESRLELPSPNPNQPPTRAPSTARDSSFQPPIDSAMKATKQSTSGGAAKPEPSQKKNSPRKSILDFFG